MEKKAVYWITEDRVGVSWYYHSHREWYFETYNGIKTVISNPSKSDDFLVLTKL